MAWKTGEKKDKAYISEKALYGQPNEKVKSIQRQRFWEMIMCLHDQVAKHTTPWLLITQESCPTMTSEAGPHPPTAQ
ncbi:uncharacterized protein G2W53_025212 [Senna tora]|uniref:Uncharacterized protein n=1 Tax=Senna tora TaxID=362788 RepID=A0A834WEJ7_9FABA|nr:uncharacterized protein G2W53_025212 [Senna tora]